MKKVLVVNASPHKSEGVVGEALGLLIENLKASRCFEIEVFYTQQQDVAPCTGCMSCRVCGSCNYRQDDSQVFVAKLQNCDILIIGMPTYWANMPGTLKVLLDRIVYALIRKVEKCMIPVPLHKGKKMVVITTCSTPKPLNFLFRQSAGALSAVKRIFKISGFRICGTLPIAGTCRGYVLNDRMRKKISCIAGKLLRS